MSILHQQGEPKSPSLIPPPILPGLNTLTKEEAMMFIEARIDRAVINSRGRLKQQYENVSIILSQSLIKMNVEFIMKKHC